MRHRRRRYGHAEGVEIGGDWRGEGCPLPSRLGGLGERRELPRQSPGRSAGRKQPFSIFRVSKNALGEQKNSAIYFSLIL